jgi:anionic cell wall polymer biosynthesis LytR-Cps2A-Psr (LCP) family protein
MASWEALDYVRQRELIPDGDYGRERHQQQFIEALTNKMASVGMLTNPLGLNKAVTAAAGALTLDTNGVSFADWIWNLSKISPSDVIMVKTNAGQFNTEVIGGQDFEILSDDSLKLFKAVKDDTVGDFVAAHPTWVSGVGQVTASANPSTTPTGRGS